MEEQTLDEVLEAHSLQQVMTMMLHLMNMVSIPTLQINFWRHFQNMRYLSLSASILVHN